MKQKVRPERLKPSLKLLTPIERKMVVTEQERIQEMWKSLYAKNKWKPQKTEEKTKNTLRRTT